MSKLTEWAEGLSLSAGGRKLVGKAGIVPVRRPSCCARGDRRLVAVWLGISADELVAMYDARSPVLQQYEENMWFDATGRRIAKAHQQYGYGQPKDAWKKLSSHENYPLMANVPEGYTRPLYRANRKDEMKAAHAEFTRRLHAAGWEPGDTAGPEATGR